MPIRSQKKLMKTTWYPQPHTIRGSMSFELDNAVMDTTIVPFAFYDEAMGDPTAKETNPRNAAFAVVNDEPNCFVDSRINNIFAQFRFNLSAQALDHNITSIRFSVMPIYMAFLENYVAIDELSQLEIQDVLELQTESTDRQGGPLYVAATDLPEMTAGIANQGANVPFLDTDAGLEGVAFNTNQYYDMLHFMTNGALLAKSTGGMKWMTLTQNRPSINMRFNIVPKVKRMNEFTYIGLLVNFPLAGNEQQNMALSEITVDTDYVHCMYSIRYNEWNENFNHRMI